VSPPVSRINFLLKKPQKSAVFVLNSSELGILKYWTVY